MSTDYSNHNCLYHRRSIGDSFAVPEPFTVPNETTFRQLRRLLGVVRACRHEYYTLWHHSKDVAELGDLLAQFLGKDAAACRLIRGAGLLHDIGKVLQPIDVLCERGKAWTLGQKRRK